MYKIPKIKKDCLQPFPVFRGIFSTEGGLTRWKHKESAIKYFRTQEMVEFDLCRIDIPRIVDRVTKWTTVNWAIVKFITEFE